jgi:hypothetical protein
MIYPIRYRVSHGHNYAGGSATHDEMVRVLRGNHDSGYHKGDYCYVVATYPADVRVDGKVAGEPLFGFEVRINPPEARFGSGHLRPAQVSWPSIGASSPEEAALFAQLVAQAAQLAAEADDWECPECAS